MILALSLLAMTLGVVRAAPGNCVQSFLVNGTTTVNQLTSDGMIAPMTVINLTPIYAPCGTDWTIMRETLTVIATDCDQIQTRDEPLLTSMGGTPKTTCFVTVSYHSTMDIQNFRIYCSPPSLYHLSWYLP
jgi:hypothetical protein